MTVTNDAELGPPQQFLSADAGRTRFGPSMATQLLVTPIVIVCALVMFAIGGIVAVSTFQNANLVTVLILVPIALFFVFTGVYLLLLLMPLWSRMRLLRDAVEIRAARWRGAVPVIPMVNVTVPYAEIAAVEKTDQIYRTFRVPSVQSVWSIVIKDGRRIEFGRGSAQSASSPDYAAAATHIAKAAGATITDTGAYRMGGLIGSFWRRGTPLADDPVGPEERTVTQGKAARAMQIAFVFVAIAMAVRGCLGGGD